MVREAKQLAALHDQAVAAARGQILIEEAESVASNILADGPREVYAYYDLLERGEEDFGLRRDPKTTAIVRAIEGGGRYIPESMPLSEALVHDRNLHSGDKDARPFKYMRAAEDYMPAPMSAFPPLTDIPDSPVNVR